MTESKTRKKKKYLIARLWRYLSRHKILIALALICMFAGNLFALFEPKLSGSAIDAMGIGPGEVDFPKVLFYVSLMAVLYLLSGGLPYLLSLLMIRLSRHVICRMRKDVFDKLSILPVGFFDRYQTGDIISVISYDIDTVNQSFSNDFLQVIQSLVIVVFSLVMMLSIAPKLVLVFAVTIPLSIFFTKFITARVRPLFRSRSKKLGELNGFVEEMIEGQKTTKAYSREAEVIARFDIKNQEAVDAYSKAEDNIAYGKEDATMEEVAEAAKAARIHDYIESLPAGYHTLLSDNGINISKGQKQLLTIARAMMLDCKMLILDEATSNVDTRTEQQIQAAMRTLMRDKTCFVIAHRLSTIRGADNILVIRDGDVVEQGNHETLMKQKGFYAKLYYAQFETY